MSANLALVRSIYAATAEGNFGTADWADQNITLELIDGPTPGRWTGIPGLTQAFRAILSAWDDFRIEADECHELDDERVLVLDRYSGRAKASGIELADVQPQGLSLFHLRDGRVDALVLYWEREAGLADLGITLEGAP